MARTSGGVLAAAVSIEGGLGTFGGANGVTISDSLILGNGRGNYRRWARVKWLFSSS